MFFDANFKNLLVLSSARSKELGVEVATPWPLF